MPPNPPARIPPGDYHFHVYDYANSGARGAWGMSDGQPARNGWQFYSMVQDLQGLVQEGQAHTVPRIALANAGGQTIGGRNTMVLSFGNANNAQDAPTVVFTGGIHAREWIAPEIAYLLAEYLIVKYNAQPQGIYQQTIKNLVDSRNIHIAPMLNPDGNDYTVFGAASTDGTEPRRWRKNFRPLPTRAADWADAVTSVNPPQTNPPFLHDLVRSQAAQDYQLGSTMALFNYDGTGANSDHAALRYQTRAIMIELDPDSQNVPVGFELPQTDIMTVFENNIRDALAALSVPTAQTAAQVTQQFINWNVYGRGNRLP